MTAYLADTVLDLLTRGADAAPAIAAPGRASRLLTVVSSKQSKMRS